MASKTDKEMHLSERSFTELRPFFAVGLPEWGLAVGRDYSFGKTDVSVTQNKCATMAGEKTALCGSGIVFHE
jgi:hypothetical protein